MAREHRHSHARAGHRELRDLENLSALVAELVLLVGLVVDEVATALAPASARRGESSFEVDAPAASRAMSIPDKSAVWTSSTSISPSAHGRRRPAEREVARKRRPSTGKRRSASTARMVEPA